MGSIEDGLIVNIGGLESTASVYRNASKGLSQFNKLWGSGNVPEVIWDIRYIRGGKMSIGAIAFFLAIAHRVKQFTKKPQSSLIEWNPKTFGFLSDIGFFDIANSYNLIEWPYEIGGYKSGQINPNTKLMACDPLLPSPDISNEDQVSEFKKVHREHYRQDIIKKCEALFSDIHTENLDKNSIPLTLSRTCAEIATNSLLWGKSTPFLGLQRTSKSIIISVSDIGAGFKWSLLAKGKYPSILKSKETDIESIALGSVLNKIGFGLKRAISMVIGLGGTISIASNAGEIFWNKDLWTSFRDTFDEKTPAMSLKNLPSPIFKASYEDRQKGYIRNWTNPIRGSRISFSIPLPLKESYNG